MSFICFFNIIRRTKIFEIYKPVLIHYGMTVTETQPEFPSTADKDIIVVSGLNVADVTLRALHSNKHKVVSINFVIDVLTRQESRNVENYLIRESEWRMNNINATLRDVVGIDVAAAVVDVHVDKSVTASPDGNALAVVNNINSNSSDSSSSSSNDNNNDQGQTTRSKTAVDDGVVKKTADKYKQTKKLLEDIVEIKDEETSQILLKRCCGDLKKYQECVSELQNPLEIISKIVDKCAIFGFIILSNSVNGQKNG